MHVLTTVRLRTAAAETPLCPPRFSPPPPSQFPSSFLSSTSCCVCSCSFSLRCFVFVESPLVSAIKRKVVGTSSNRKSSYKTYSYRKSSYRTSSYRKSSNRSFSYRKSIFRTSGYRKLSYRKSSYRRSSYRKSNLGPSVAGSCGCSRQKTMHTVTLLPPTSCQVD